MPYSAASDLDLHCFLRPVCKYRVLGIPSNPSSSNPSSYYHTDHQDETNSSCSVFKRKGYLFKGDNSVKLFLPPFRKGFTIKGKNLLPMGAIFFFLE